MKYLKAKFTNYIGFYNGMNLDVIEFDFTRCKHNIILIEGKNGSGKSTLLNHLNPFPDGSNSFIPNKTAVKELILANGDDSYYINISSPADLKGRKTTKAYIKKNGIELNENGNVSSYKDIIFSEFELDSNYISLSRLSSNDRGLGDKTPAERKRFVANIINNLEIYNTMYKTLNKKSIIYKSHINTLHTKIQNIGDKNMLEQSLGNLRRKEADLNARIMDANNQIVAINTKNSIDESEAKKIQEANNKYTLLSDQVAAKETSLNMYLHKTRIKKEDISEKYNTDNALLSTYQSDYDVLHNSWKEKCTRLSGVSENIVSLQATVDSTDINDKVSSEYSESKAAIEGYNKNLIDLKIDVNHTTIYEMSNLIRFCDKFILMVDHLYDNASTEDIEFIANYNPKVISDLIDLQNDTMLTMQHIKSEMEDINAKIKVISILDQRPSKCKIDNCPFISDAIELKKSQKGDLLDQLASLQSQLLSFTNESTEIQNKIDYSNSLLPKKMELDAIRTLISDNLESISKFYPDFYATFNSRLVCLDIFNDIRDHSRIIDGLNLLKLLDAETQRFNILEVEYNSFKEKIQLINTSRNMLNKLLQEQSELSTETSSMKDKLNSYNSLIEELTKNIAVEANYYNEYTQYSSLVSELEEINQVLKEFNEKSSKAMESISIINTLKESIARDSAELQPVQKDISTISGQLVLLESYYKEYNEYNASYKTIETLKKYCSPTGGGIQTLFMQMYMSKTKELANEVLGMLFNGSYQLLDFIINDNEFRIPFIGEGLPVDDISSGSSAQITMMGTIINLVLLYQGSTKLNIAMLDEISGPLDTYNNSQFINVLFYCMKILNIEQLFLISHSTEMDNTFADIIKLKWYDNFENSIQSGNIIFDYDEYIKEVP